MALVITEVGLGILSNRMKGVGDEPLYIGWGTGAEKALAADLILSDEDATVGYARVLGVSTLETTTVTNDTYVVTATLTALAALSITNWGLFDAVSGGNLVAKESRSTAVVVALDGTLTIVMKFKFAQKV